MATYISLDNLARYDMKAKARAEGLYADASAACWQKTEKAGAVTCVPAPETPLEPVVEFLFAESSGEISGVSSIAVTVCEEQGVDETEYAISLPSTFYGGTLDVASGRLTVTHRMVEPSSGTVDISDRPALLPLEYTDTYGRTVTASADGTSLDCGTSGGQIVYRLANPYTVQIDPTPIDSLPALGRTSPRVNTVYTDALNVQVGYAEHPAYTEELINNAILALGGDI